MTSIKLPYEDGSIQKYILNEASSFKLKQEQAFNRTAYAAAHVVVDTMAQQDPWQQSVIDWDSTIEYRNRLWDMGFRVAEAMDTSQRGMGLSWSQALELIKRSVEAAKSHDNGELACGAGTDQLMDTAKYTLDAVVAAYEQQFEQIESVGGKTIIMMASRALAKAAKGPEDYLSVYERIISQYNGKIILHWLGDMFDPSLNGYWGCSNDSDAMAVVVDLIKSNVNKIDGIKISLLDKEKEIALRRLLPESVKMYTGDDFNYAELIAGDEYGVSHALLGIFDPIAPAACAALQALANEEHEKYYKILEPTVALSREIFKAPTQFYKAGVVFMAWLNGFQKHFSMVGGMQSARDIQHYSKVFQLADQAGLLLNPEDAVRRMKSLLDTYGIDQ